MEGARWKQKNKDKTGNKDARDVEAERAFDELRRKYAYVIAYLLVTNIG